MEKKIVIKHKKKEIEKIVEDITKYIKPFLNEPYVFIEFKLSENNSNIINEKESVSPYVIIYQLPQKNPLTKEDYLDIKLLFSIAELNGLINFIKTHDFKVKLSYDSLVFILNDDKDYLIVTEDEKYNTIKKIKQDASASIFFYI